METGEAARIRNRVIARLDPRMTQVAEYIANDYGLRQGS